MDADLRSAARNRGDGLPVRPHRSPLPGPRVAASCHVDRRNGADRGPQPASPRRDPRRSRSVDLDDRRVRVATACKLSLRSRIAARREEICWPAAQSETKEANLAVRTQSLENPRARPRRDLGAMRTMMAADRTLMAWIRTALSLLSFGFTIYKILQEVEKSVALPRDNSPRNVGILLAASGTMAMVMGSIEY